MDAVGMYGYGADGHIVQRRFGSPGVIGQQQNCIVEVVRRCRRMAARRPALVFGVEVRVCHAGHLRTDCLPYTTM